MKETMTIHKALSELKILDSRISDKIEKSEFVTANKHSNAKIHGVSVETFCKDAKEGYQSLMTLINRRNAIKRAVTKSNAITEVTIGGKTYTVAEAIDMKAMGCKYLTAVAARLNNQFALASRKADMENDERLNDRADEYIKSLYSGSDLKNMSDEIKKVRDAFIVAQTIEVVDPVGAQETASKLQDEADTFLSDVDSALSVSNALTTVEVEYETL